MNESREIPQPVGISLVRKTDTLNRHEDFFEGEKIPIPGLGNVKLTASKEEGEYLDNPSGLAFKDGELVTGNPEQLLEGGLYAVDITAFGVRGSTNPLQVRMHLPNNEILTSTFEFGEDNQQDEDPENRHKGMALHWKKEGDDSENIFFVPDDQDMLSEIQFSFHSGPQKQTGQ